MAQREIDEIGSSELDKLESYYKRNESVVINTEVGSGVESRVEEFAKKEAEKRNIEFVHWSELEGDDRRDVLSNPSEYFVLSIMRGDKYPYEIEDVVDIGENVINKGNGLIMLTEINYLPDDLRHNIIEKASNDRNVFRIFTMSP